MPAPVYSLRIFAAGGVDAAAGLLGPLVPDAFNYVVRDIDVVERSGSLPAELLFTSQVGALLWVVERNAAGDPIVGQWRGRQVFQPGERVGVQAVSGSWDVAISGYQLTLP